MKLGDICTREVVFAHYALSLQQAAALMRERHVGALVLTHESCDGPQVIGIVTDRDIVLEAIARGADIARTEIGQVATPKVATLPVESDIEEAIALMKELGVRRLMVTAKDGSLCGVVSVDDLLGALGHEMAELAPALHNGIERKSATLVSAAQRFT